jgi:hypothetical protein
MAAPGRLTAVLLLPVIHAMQGTIITLWRRTNDAFALRKSGVAQALLWVKSVALCNKRPPVDVRYVPLSDRDCLALRYVAMGQ